jgi:hypothetical protein
LKPFKFYIESGLVRQGSKDPGESKAMIGRASKRLEYVRSQSITEDNSSFLVTIRPNIYSFLYNIRFLSNIDHQFFYVAMFGMNAFPDNTS